MYGTINTNFKTTHEIAVNSATTQQSIDSRSSFTNENFTDCLPKWTDRTYAER